MTAAIAVLAVDGTVRRHAQFSLVAALVGLFLLLNLADAALTAWGLALGAVELNPLMDALGGPVPFLALKLAVGCVVAWGSLRRASSSLLLYLEYAGMYGLVSMLYVWVVCHNAGVVLRLLQAAGS